MLDAAEANARRGELRLPFPFGYVWSRDLIFLRPTDGKRLDELFQVRVEAAFGLRTKDGADGGSQPFVSVGSGIDDIGLAFCRGERVIRGCRGQAEPIRSGLQAEPVRVGRAEVQSLLRLLPGLTFGSGGTSQGAVSGTDRCLRLIPMSSKASKRAVAEAATSPSKNGASSIRRIGASPDTMVPTTKPTHGNPKAVAGLRGMTRQTAISVTGMVI